MPVKLVPPSRNAAAEQLMKLFAQTEQKLIAEITRKRAAGYVDYAETAALRRIRETMQKMVDESAKYVPLAIEKEFYKGEKHAAGYRNARQVVTPGRTRAAEILTDNLLGQIQEMAGNALADATTKVQLIGRPDADIFRTLGLRTASQNVAIGASGMGGVEAMARALEASGITAFVDKAGRPWSLRAYGNLAVRTTVKQAQVSAVLTEDDHDLYQIVRHNAPCRLCATYSGRVYSKSGTNPHYPPLAMAFGKIDPAGPNDLSNSFLNIHPNCLCTLIRYTEAGKTEKQIEQMREASSFAKHPADVDPRTKKEIEAYRRKERNRAELMGMYHEWERMREQGIAGVPTSFNRFWDEYKKDSPLYNRWLSSYTPPPKNKPKPVQPAPTQQAPAPVPVFVSAYKTAATIEEAEDLAKHFADKNAGFAATGISYKGVSVEVANKVNKTLYDFYDEYDVPMFGGVIAPARNTRYGKMIEGATAAYSPLQRSFLLNRGTLKDMKTATAALKAEKEAIVSILEHPERYDFDRMRTRVRKVVEASKLSGRATVPETIEEVISHELGHALERNLKDYPGLESIRANMPKYAEKISGYATESFSEYVAESFASYRKGENLADPEIVKAFESFRRVKP